MFKTIDHEDEKNSKAKLLRTSTMSILMNPFNNYEIFYPPSSSLSSYPPSCHMMDLIVHEINNELSGSYYFKKATPYYHPYILRLYFGVLFWVQCLRAGLDVYEINSDHCIFLNNFLSRYPPETLPIPGPLLPLFKTLCSSQPEFENYGKVYPRLPSHPGPSRRSKFMRKEVEHFFLPNVHGIFALLTALLDSIKANPDVFPRTGEHVPVTEKDVTGTIFGHHKFPGVADRNGYEKWFLVSPGLQYPCEADQKIYEAFAELYPGYHFPVTDPNDELRSLDQFLCMDKRMDWFCKVKHVASIASSFFVGSGTLADCSPRGLVSNQVVVCHMDPTKDVPSPRCSADARSVYTPSFYLESSVRHLPPHAEATAAFAQTHIRASADHPMYAGFGDPDNNLGPFLSIRPIETSYVHNNIFFSVYEMLKSKGRT